MNNKILTRFLIIFLLLIGATLLIFPLERKINLGLDLKGGMHLIMKVDTSSLSPKEKSGAAERAVEIIRNRIDALGVREPLIQPQGTEELLIQLPGVVDRERALAIIGQTALLEFRLVESNPPAPTPGQTQAIPDGYEFKDSKQGAILVQKEAAVSGKDLADAQMGFDSMGFGYVSIKFNAEGSKKFADVTNKNVGKQLAIVLDGIVKSAPVIKEPILTGDAQITGDFSANDASDLALILRSGALPCPLYIEEERTVGPLLGEDSIRKGLSASLIAAGAVALFMIIYYLLPGFISVIALCFNLVLILFGMSILKATLTLPGIAGIILSLGMAVDANVLIYERMREELALKKPLLSVIKLGYDKAFSAIIDSNLTTVVAALCLFIFGTGPIRGFGVTLMLGICASMFTAIVVTRVIFELLVYYRKLKTIVMLHLLKKPNINFISVGKFFTTISLGILCIGTFFFFKGKETIYGIDFSGGQIQEYSFHQDLVIENIRKYFTEANLSLELYTFKNKKNILTIRSADDTFTQVKTILEKYYPGQYDILRVEKVGPVVGKLLQRKAIFAIAFALLGILLYVAFRFKHFDFALAGVLALFHDVLISFSFLLFFSYKINLLSVTAFLTIAGYSINDTIVIYDRIRELMVQMKKASLKEVINAALNQTFSRTLITSLTVIMVVCIFFFLGPDTLKDFSFTLLVGFIAGVYSTIFIVSPLVVWLRRKNAA